MKHFYTHIIDLGDIDREFKILDLTDDEKNHLVLVIESTIHHIIIDTVLTELPDEHKHTFLKHVTDEDHKSIWELLRSVIKDPEEQIRYAVNKYKKEIMKDIRDLHDKIND